MLSDWRGIKNSIRNPFFCYNGKCFVVVLPSSLLRFDYDLTVFQAWHRHQSTRISIGNAVMLSDWRRIKNSSRNPFFVTMVSVLLLFCRRHFLRFDYDLTVFQAWLRHHSTWNSIRITMIPLDGRRIGNSCRNLFFCDQVSVLSQSLFTF